MSNIFVYSNGMLSCDFYAVCSVRTSESFVVQLCTFSLLQKNKPHRHLQRLYLQSTPHSESHLSQLNAVITDIPINVQ